MSVLNLDIYIANDCWTCEESRRIARRVEVRFPEIDVHLISLDNAERPSYVFAAPTYVLNERVAFLGNPRWHELEQKLVAALSDRVVTRGERE